MNGQSFDQMLSYTALRYNVTRLYGDWETVCILMAIYICINKLKDGINVYT